MQLLSRQVRERKFIVRCGVGIIQASQPLKNMIILICHDQSSMLLCACDSFQLYFSIKQGFFSVAAGQNHSLFMTDALSVWGCGSNIFGQLGHSSSNLQSSPSQNQSSISSPAPFGSSQPHSPLRGQSPSIGGSGIANNNGNIVTPFNKKNSQQVSAHGGGIRQIQSKTSSQNVPFVPLKAIDAFQSPNQVQCISCGAEHCMALTTNGELYSWGLGCQGQLSQNNYKNYQTPAFVQIMAPNGAANSKVSDKLNDNESTSAQRKAPQLEQGVANSLLSYLKRTTGGSGAGGSRNIGMNSRGKSETAQRGQNIAGHGGGFNKTVGGYTYMQDRLGNNRGGGGGGGGVVGAPTLDLGSSRNSYQQQPPQLGGTTGKLGRQKVSLSSSSNQNDLSSNKFSKSMDFSNASRVEGSSIDDNSLFALQQQQITQVYLMKQNQQVSEIACGAVHSIV